jgi:hypothetical protein
MDFRLNPLELDIFEPITDIPTVRDDNQSILQYADDRKYTPLRESAESETIDHLVTQIDEYNVEKKIFPQSPNLETYESFKNVEQFLRKLDINGVLIREVDNGVNEYITPVMLNDSIRFRTHLLTRISFLECKIINYVSDYRDVLLGYIDAYHAMDAKELREDSSRGVDLPTEYYTGHILNTVSIRLSDSPLSQQINHSRMGDVFELQDDLMGKFSQDDDFLISNHSERSVSELLDLYNKINTSISSLQEIGY